MVYQYFQMISVHGNTVLSMSRCMKLSSNMEDWRFRRKKELKT